MNLYYINRTDEWSWDEYDSAVVVAASEEEARGIHPSGDQSNWTDNLDSQGNPWDWTNKKNIVARLIGVAAEGETGVICASFNAG